MGCCMKLLVLVMTGFLMACASKPSKADIVNAKIRAEHETASRARAAETQRLNLYFKKESETHEAYYTAAGRLELFKEMGVDPNVPPRGGGGFVNSAPSRSLSEEMAAGDFLRAQQQQIQATREVAGAIDTASRNAIFDAAFYR
jgi:hypothetical protein